MDFGGWNIDITNPWSNKVFALNSAKDNAGKGKWGSHSLAK